MGDADVLMSASEEPTQDDPEDAVMEDALVENVETSARPTSASNTECSRPNIQGEVQPRPGAESHGSAYPNAPPTVTPSMMYPTVPMDYVADANMSALDHALALAQQILVNGVCAPASPLTPAVYTRQPSNGRLHTRAVLSAISAGKYTDGIRASGIHDTSTSRVALHTIVDQ